MSRYGPGVSMKSAMRMNMETVENVLSKYNLSVEDAKQITDILKEAYFWYANCNAYAFFFDETCNQLFGEKAMKKVYPLLFTGVPFITEKLDETYPEEWKDDIEDKTN